MKQNKINLKTTYPITTFKSNFPKKNRVKLSIANDNNILTSANDNNQFSNYIIKRQNTPVLVGAKDHMMIDGICSLSAIDYQKHLILPSAYEKIFKQSLENVKIVKNHNYTESLLGSIVELSLVKVHVKPPTFLKSNRQYTEVYGLYVKIKFHNTPEGEMAYKQYEHQSVPSFSIGFEAMKYHSIPICQMKSSNYKNYLSFIDCSAFESDKNQSIWVLEAMNLIEISLVPIPANPYCHTTSYAKRLDLIDFSKIEYVDKDKYCYIDRLHNNRNSDDGNIGSGHKKQANNNGTNGSNIKTISNQTSNTLSNKASIKLNETQNIVRAYLGDDTVGNLEDDCKDLLELEKLHSSKSKVYEKITDAASNIKMQNNKKKT